MAMPNLKELIERLERAEGPDRELDLEIANALGFMCDRTQAFLAKDYTSSIDAALTLVPEGASLEHLGQFMVLGIDDAPLWQAKIRLRTLKNVHDKKRSDVIGTGLLKSPVIALCIAALKARSALRARSSRGGVR